MKKQFRILKNQEFQSILKKRKFISGLGTVLYYQPRALERARVGITVSKKIGNAVVRNKIKRQIRMMCQTALNFDEPYDVIIMVRSKYLEFSYQENLDNILQQINKLDQQFNHRRNHD